MKNRSEQYSYQELVVLETALEVFLKEGQSFEFRGCKSLESVATRLLEDMREAGASTRQKYPDLAEAMKEQAEGWR